MTTLNASASSFPATSPAMPVIQLLERLTKALISRIKMEGAVEPVFLSEIINMQDSAEFVPFVEFYAFIERFYSSDDSGLSIEETERYERLERDLEAILGEFNSFRFHRYGDDITAEQILLQFMDLLRLECLRMALEHLQQNPLLLVLGAPGVGGSQVANAFTTKLRVELAWFWGLELFFNFTEHSIFNLAPQFLLEATEKVGVHLDLDANFINAFFYCSQKIYAGIPIQFEKINFYDDMRAFIEQCSNPGVDDDVQNTREHLATFGRRLRSKPRRRATTVSVRKCIRDLKKWFEDYDHRLTVKDILAQGDGSEGKPNNMSIESWIEVLENDGLTQYLKTGAAYVRECLFACVPLERMEMYCFIELMRWLSTIYSVELFVVALQKLNQNPEWEFFLADSESFSELLYVLDPPRVAAILQHSGHYVSAEVEGEALSIQLSTVLQNMQMPTLDQQVEHEHNVATQTGAPVLRSTIVISWLKKCENESLRQTLWLICMTPFVEFISDLIVSPEWHAFAKEWQALVALDAINVQECLQLLQPNLIAALSKNAAFFSAVFNIFSSDDQAQLWTTIRAELPRWIRSMEDYVAYTKPLAVEQKTVIEDAYPIYKKKLLASVRSLGLNDPSQLNALFDACSQAQKQKILVDSLKQHPEFWSEIVLDMQKLILPDADKPPYAVAHRIELTLFGKRRFATCYRLRFLDESVATQADFERCRAQLPEASQSVFDQLYPQFVGFNAEATMESAFKRSRM